MTTSQQTRTTVYLTKQDRDRLAQLKQRYGLGVSAAVRAGLALLERQMADTKGEGTMITVYTEVQEQGISEDNPGLMEYGYGQYVNAFVVDEELGGNQGMYATERVPFDADQERISKARKLARQRARRRYQAELSNI